VGSWRNSTVTRASRRDDGALLACGAVTWNEDRSGVLVLRAWLHDDEIVARVRTSMSGDELHDAALGIGVEPIVEIVRGWLGDLVATER
jgi:hypothetical protein